MALLFSFFVEEIRSLVKATSVIGDVDDIVDLKFSREMFAMMVESSIAPTSIIALRLSHGFFQEYSCRHLQYSWTYIKNIYPEMLLLEESGFTSLNFSFANPRRANLTYGYEHAAWEVNFPLHEMDASRDVGQYTCAIFVSIDSERFINIITELHPYDHVYVTLTSSQVKFSCLPMIHIVLTPEDECLIGGVGEGIEINFTITLHPMEGLCNMVRQCERVWIFKATNTADGVICAPIGLHAQFLAYPPDMRII